MISKILIADDLSKRAEEVLKVGLDLAAKYQAKAFILNVRQDFLDKDEMVMLRVDVSEFQNDVKRKALETKRKIESDIKQLTPPTLSVEILLREGKPPDTICEVAEEMSADLIVIGRKGTSLLKDIFFGSTATAVVKNAQTSVLTVWA